MRSEISSDRMMDIQTDYKKRPIGHKIIGDLHTDSKRSNVAYEDSHSRLLNAYIDRLTSLFDIPHIIQHTHLLLPDNV